MHLTSNLIQPYEIVTPGDSKHLEEIYSELAERINQECNGGVIKLQDRVRRLQLVIIENILETNNPSIVENILQRLKETKGGDDLIENFEGFTHGYYNYDKLSQQEKKALEEELRELLDELAPMEQELVNTMDNNSGEEGYRAYKAYEQLLLLRILFSKK